MFKYYDMIALDYDQLIEEDVLQGSFPFGGYLELQDMIVNEIFDNKHITQANILDIGIGTASMYERFSPGSIALTGIDASKKMLEVAKLKLPQATLLQHDIMKGFPDELEGKLYDYVVINYLCMHFDLITLIDLVHQLAKFLAPFGKIFIGDLMFLNTTNKNQYFIHNPLVLNYHYHFHTFEEIIEQMGDDFALNFMEINSYTGILIIDKYHESPLHYEESLLKYKTNTEKWKSSQSRKKRE